LKKVYLELVKSIEANNYDPIRRLGSGIFKSTILLSLFEKDWKEKRVPKFETEIKNAFKERSDKWLLAYKELCSIIWEWNLSS